MKAMMFETIAPLIINGLTGAAGFCAIAIYLAQKHDSRANAAIMVTQQIDLINQETINIRSKINDSSPSFTYLYELPPLMQVNYWEKYKHLFIKYLSSKQLAEIDSFYRNASVIVEQQAFVKEITHNYYEEVQRNTLDFNKEQAKIEYSKAMESHPADTFIEKMLELQLIDNEHSSTAKQAIRNLFPNNIDNVANIMTASHQLVLQTIDRTLYKQVSLFYEQYMPMQVNNLVVKALDTISHLSITNSKGYDVLNSIGRRHLFSLHRGRMQSK